MTGAEMAAGAAAASVGKAAAEAVREEVSLSRDLRRLASDKAGMQAAASAYGRRQAVKQEILLNLFRPLASIVGVSRDYFESQFGEDLAEKMSEVPDEETRTPRLSVAGPAMQGLGFSLQEAELKDMYLELLARASDGRTIEDAHPSFVDVIRQLTASEAGYLKTYLGVQHQAVMRVAMVYLPGGNKSVMNRHVTDQREPDGSYLRDEHFSTYVDNWIRLGLIECDYSGYLTREGAYDWVDDHPLMIQGQAQIDYAMTHGQLAEGVERMECVADKGVISRTTFGEQFAKVVALIDEEDSASSSSNGETTAPDIA
jgi:hypothetical protein